MLAQDTDNNNNNGTTLCQIMQLYSLGSYKYTDVLLLLLCCLLLLVLVPCLVPLMLFTHLVFLLSSFSCDETPVLL